MIKNILIIDDSALMRRLMSDIIQSDTRFRVLETANNGQQGYDYLVKYYNEIDCVLLDINMPIMNGLEFLELMQKHRIKKNVIVVSTVAKEGAKETIRALELGAFDFITKPGSYFEAKSEAFKIKLLHGIETATQEVSRMTSSTSSIPRTLSRSIDFATKETKSLVSNQIVNEPVKVEKKPFVKKKNGSKLIALACSTGGPKALQKVIPKLPKDLPCSVLVVQHMPEGFTKSLAERLNELSQVTVTEAQDGDIIEPGHVYIAKGGSQMRIKRVGTNKYALTVTVEDARNGLKPCADILYESIVNTDIDEITCVVLTGMGNDGTKGIAQLSQKNNIYVVAQDQESSTVYGMPKAVWQAGLVDEVVSIEGITEAIVKNVGV